MEWALGADADRSRRPDEARRWLVWAELGRSIEDELLAPEWQVEQLDARKDRGVREQSQSEARKVALVAQAG